MIDKNQIYDILNKSGFEYKVFEHIPVYTIDEIDALSIPGKENIAKNLFLRDDKGKKHYLVTLPGYKKLDIKELSVKIKSRKLSFASEQRLEKYLSLKKGSVTPFGLLNDKDNEVIFVYEKSLVGKTIGVHPMENTATVFISFEDMLNLIQINGNKTVCFEI